MKVIPDEFTPYKKESKPKIYTQIKKPFCDWTDEKNYLIHYRMLKFYVEHRVIVDKVREVLSFKQKNGWKDI